MSFARSGSGARLVFVIQRGAADGLGILAPVADPAYAGLRRDLADIYAERPLLDGLFALHPSLENIAAMHGAGEALFVHAVASAYRDRSHFDGQNMLETGGDRPYGRVDGWLNRLLALFPDGEREALAFAPTLPPALRGEFAAGSYAPSRLPDPQADLLERVSQLYSDDAVLHPIWDQAMQTRAMVGEDVTAGQFDGAAAGRLAAGLLAREDGPNIAMIETNGWDTHSGQRFRLGARLRDLDLLLAALRDGLGDRWPNTLVIVATEFGRTAAANGTGGTDHGTASAAILAGGAVRGGRIIADWPGLRERDLYEGRDLKPTQSLEGLFAGSTAELLGIDPGHAMGLLYPHLPPELALTGLISRG